MRNSSERGFVIMLSCFYVILMCFTLILFYYTCCWKWCDLMFKCLVLVCAEDFRFDLIFINICYTLSFWYSFSYLWDYFSFQYSLSFLNVLIVIIIGMPLSALLTVHPTEYFLLLYLFWSEISRHFLLLYLLFFGIDWNIFCIFNHLGRSGMFHRLFTFIVASNVFGSSSVLLLCSRDCVFGSFFIVCVFFNYHGLFAHSFVVVLCVWTQGCLVRNALILWWWVCNDSRQYLTGYFILRG